MLPTWHIHDMTLERAKEAWIADIGSIFLDGFGLPEDRAWSPDRIAHALGNISYLAIAYTSDQPSERKVAYGYALYTVPSVPLGNGTYLLWEDAICLRKSMQGSGAPRELFAAITKRSRHQPIGWIGGRTQNPRVMRTYRKFGHAFPFAEDYSTPDGQAIMSFLREQVREVRDVPTTSLDLACGIARGIYRQGRLGDYPVNVENTSDIEQQLTSWGFNRDRGDAVIVAARLDAQFVDTPDPPMRSTWPR
jgi:GNAT superfamily N-acetyltransferase